MSNYYKSITTPVLEKMWERERDRLLKLPDATIADYDDLYAMRQELDRRRGISLPETSINFEKFVTD